TAYCDSVGLPLPENRRQTYQGVKWIHLMRDIQAALYHLFRRELTLRDWWRSTRGVKAFAVFSWRDPLPFLSAVSQSLFVALSPRERG
ncbi:MAG: carboxylate--amine ligase, partial [Chloroflexota bacterium]